MSINEYVKLKKDELLEHYLRNPTEMFRDYEIEREKIDDYNGRQLLELIQNADDETENDTVEKEVYIKFEDNVLIVANNGNSFSKAGVFSLMRSHSSPKRQLKKIGQKGTGFRSVLNWSDSVYIKSGDLSIEFSERHAERALQSLKQASLDFAGIVEKNPHRLPIAILSCPCEKEKGEGYSDYETYIEIHVEDNKDIYNSIKDQINRIDGETLLFINNIETIRIDFEGKTTIYEKKPLNTEGSQIRITYSDGREAEIWYISKKTGEMEVEERKEKWIKGYELKVAYTLPLKYRSGKLYSYFKTNVQFDFPAAIHGTFNLSGDRNYINETSENKKLLGLLAELLVETALKICEGRISYEPLSLVMFKNTFDEKIKRMGFESILLEKIKKSKILPTVNNRYINTDNEIVYYNSPSVSLFRKLAALDLLLLHADDANITEFLKKKLDAKVYTYNFLTKYVNEKIDTFNPTEKTELLKFYLDFYGDEMRNPNTIKPLLLINSNKDKILPKDETFFPPTTVETTAPKFVSVDIIDYEQLDDIKMKLGTNNQNILMEKLKGYGIKLYSLHEIIQKTSSLFKDRYAEDKSIFTDYLKWLYDMYRLPDNKASNVSIYFPNKDKGLAQSNTLYFGDDYGNEFGASLVSILGKDDLLVISKSEIELLIASDDIMNFFKWLGVSEYPNPLNEEDLSHIAEASETEQLIAWCMIDSRFCNNLNNTKVSKILRSISWVQTKFGIRQLVEKSCMINNIDKGFKGILECVDINYESIYFKGMYSKSEVNYWLGQMGVIDNFSKMSVKNMYDILLSAQDKGSKEDTKNLYNKIVENVPVGLPAKDNYCNERNIFINTGSILAVKNSERDFYSVSEVVFVGKKKLCKEILRQFAVIEIKANKSRENVEKVFGVKIIKSFSETVVEKHVHKMEQFFKAQIKALLPYLYCYRMDVDSERKELKQLQSMQIYLCSDIKAYYVYEGSKIDLKLEPYEYIYEKDKNEAYILLEDDIFKTNQLLGNYSISQTLEEILSEVTDLQIMGEKGAKLFMLTEENKRKMLSGDGCLEDLQAAQTLFNFDYKERFWEAIKNHTGLETIEISNELQEFFDNDFNYVEIDYRKSFRRLKELFETVGMDIEDFNKNHPFGIDLITYYRRTANELLLRLSKKYCQYLYEKLQKSALSEKMKLEEYVHNFKKHHVDIDYKSSIHFDIAKTISEHFGIDIGTIERLDDNYHLYKYNENKERILEDMGIYEDDDLFHSPSKNSLVYFYDDAEVVKWFDDYIKERNSLSAAKPYGNTDESIADHHVQITMTNIMVKCPDEKNGGGGGRNGPGRAYRGTDNTEKGLMGEEYVYEELAKDESVTCLEWVSGNAQKAKATTYGDDSLGYDMRYCLKADPNRMIYVEVKATTGNSLAFHLSRNEKEWAEAHKDSYIIMVVTNINSTRPEIYNLGCIFDYAGDEDFFHNSRFAVETDSFVIKTQKSDAESSH